MEKGFLISSLYIMISLVSILLFSHNNKELQNSLFLSNKTKISLEKIFLIALLFVFFNFLTTKISGGFGYDRSNYLIEYNGIRESNSIILDLLFAYFNKFNLTFELFLYFTTFITVFLVLIAYRKSQFSDYKLWMLLLSSEFIFSSLSAIKQIYASAFASIFFVILLENNKKTVKCLLLATISSLFHISGLILFPILLLNTIKKINKTFLIIILVIGIFFMFNFYYVLAVISQLITPIFPQYGTKITNYIEDFYNDSSYNIFSFIKYLPMYYISILGLIKRKRYSVKIPNYNKYLIISLINSFLVLSSLYIYWFSRFGLIFYFPVFQFFNLIINADKSKKNKTFNFCMVFSLGYVILIRKIITMFINYGML